jgi:hypothetical protein
VTITVDAANDAPVAVGENFTTPQNTAITVTTLLDNDRMRTRATPSP